MGTGMGREKVQPTPGTEGTLAELADPGFAVDPQWIVWADVAEGPSQGPRATSDQWVVWPDAEDEERWADVELGHLIGIPARGS